MSAGIVTAFCACILSGLWVPLVIQPTLISLSSFKGLALNETLLTVLKCFTRKSRSGAFLCLYKDSTWFAIIFAIFIATGFTLATRRRYTGRSLNGNLLNYMLTPQGTSASIPILNPSRYPYSYSYLSFSFYTI
jgi:hypothetical protein